MVDLHQVQQVIHLSILDRSDFHCLLPLDIEILGKFVVFLPWHSNVFLLFMI